LVYRRTPIFASALPFVPFPLEFQLAEWFFFPPPLFPRRPGQSDFVCLKFTFFGFFFPFSSHKSRGPTPSPSFSPLCRRTFIHPVPVPPEQVRPVSFCFLWTGTDWPFPLLQHCRKTTKPPPTGSFPSQRHRASSFFGFPFCMLFAIGGTPFF